MTLNQRRINAACILFFICVLNSFAQEDPRIMDYKYAGPPYYPEEYLSEKDSLKWPLIFEISIDVKDIKGLDINRDEFFAKLLVSSYSQYDKLFVTQKKDTISLLHEEFITIYVKENNLGGQHQSRPNYYINNSNYSYLFSDGFKSKSVRLVEAPFDLNWNLRNFPFDKQQLKFKFITTVDTSIIKLQPSKKFPSTFQQTMDNLKDGFNVQSIEYNYTYNTDEGDLILVAPNKVRGIVTETLEVILNLDRQGSWLFLKLFIGGILSYFLSCLIFLIPSKEFESKITLLVGAIFGAIGNRYFVDSVLPGVQVFTKADAVSNLIIILVVFNILVMILQHSNKNYFRFFQSPKNSFFYSLYSFTILLIAILIW